MPAGVRAGFFLSPNRCVAGENTRGARDERRALLFSPATQRFGDKKNPARSSAGTDPPRAIIFTRDGARAYFFTEQKVWSASKIYGEHNVLPRNKLWSTPREKCAFSEGKTMLRRGKKKSKNYNKINIRHRKS